MDILDYNTVMEDKKFYKYREFDMAPRENGEISDSTKYTLNLLKDGELYFAAPSEFNDPYDALIEYDMSLLSLKHLRKNKEERIRMHPNEAPEIEFMLTHPKEGERRMKDLASYLTPHINQPHRGCHHFEYLRICCLCQSYNVTHMWNKYADKETGICVELRPELLYFPHHGWHPAPALGFLNCSKLTADKEFYERSIVLYRDLAYLELEKVEYRKHRLPPIDFWGSDVNDLRNYLKTKTLKWKDEKEWRMIMNVHGVETMNIRLARNTITRIYLGPNINAVSKNTVLELVSDKSCNCYGAEVVQLEKVGRDNYICNTLL